MILCILSVTLLVIGIGLLRVCFIKNFDDNFFFYISETITMLGCVGCTLCCVTLLTSRLGIKSEIVKNAQQYSVLTKQAEIYNNDPNKDYITYSQFLKEAAEFNSKLYINDYYHNSLWVGVFNPDKFERLDYIRYEGYIQYNKF